MERAMFVNSTPPHGSMVARYSRCSDGKPLTEAVEGCRSRELLAPSFTWNIRIVSVVCISEGCLTLEVARKVRGGTAF